MEVPPYSNNYMCFFSSDRQNNEKNNYGHFFLSDMQNKVTILYHKSCGIQTGNFSLSSKQIESKREVDILTVKINILHNRHW